MITSLDNTQVHKINKQMMAAQEIKELSYRSSKSFDLILNMNQYEKSLEEISEYLESYWEATRPPVTLDPNISELLLRSLKGPSNHTDIVTMSSMMYNCALLGETQILGIILTN